MEIFNRSEALESLMYQLDIPRMWFPHKIRKGIGPYDVEYFERELKSRKVSELAAVAALEAMTDEKLLVLHETPGALDKFAFQFCIFERSPWYNGGFNVDGRTADYDFWAKMDFWTREEANCLSIGFEPQKMPEKTDAILPSEHPLEFFWERLSLIERAPFNVGQQNKVSPITFLAWIKGKSIDVPLELIAAVEGQSIQSDLEMLKKVDRRLYDSAQKAILGLLAYQYGFRGGEMASDIKADIISGMNDLGINLDRKTVLRVLRDAESERPRFAAEQEMRDSKT